MFQRRRCCAFDSPELPNDSAGYPGLAYVVRGTTPSVLCFFGVIRHKSPRYTHVFTEKLNTYGVESPCECLPGVGSSLANPGLSKIQLVPSCEMKQL